mgnify:FL=1
MSFTILPVGRVVGGRVPADDDDWDAVTARGGRLALGVTGCALLGLDAFSHAEIVYLFDKLPESQVTTGARRPRGNPDWPLVGIFAQRGRNRPNRLAVSVCRIEKVEGTTLHVRGLDAIDGTPVVDIKPVMRGFAPRGEIREPDWAREIMSGYW